MYDFRYVEKIIFENNAECEMIINKLIKIFEKVYQYKNYNEAQEGEKQVLDELVNYVFVNLLQVYYTEELLDTSLTKNIFNCKK